jgi:hypothetical protein
MLNLCGNILKTLEICAASQRWGVTSRHQDADAKSGFKDIERERAALVEAPPTWTPAQIRSMCGERLRRFHELLDGNVAVANQAVGKLLAKPFDF